MRVSQTLKGTFARFHHILSIQLPWEGRKLCRDLQFPYVLYVSYVYIYIYPYIHIYIYMYVSSVFLGLFLFSKNQQRNGKKGKT